MECPCGETETMPSVRSVIAFKCGSRLRSPAGTWMTLWNSLPCKASKVIVELDNGHIHRATRIQGAAMVNGARDFYLDDEPHDGKSIQIVEQQAAFVDYRVQELSGWQKVLHGGRDDMEHKELCNVVREVDRKQCACGTHHLMRGECTWDYVSLSDRVDTIVQ